MGIEAEGLVPLIQVFDMPTSIHFYRDIVGFEVIQTSPPKKSADDVGWALLRLGDAELMLNTRYEDHARPPAPDPARIAMHDDVGLFIGCRDVEGAYRHLIARGLKLEPPKVVPYGMKQLYVTDPDGYVLCFQWSAE
jgi:glyoxylase I family protein